MLTAHQRIAIRRLLPDYIEIIKRGDALEITDIRLPDGRALIVYFGRPTGKRIARLVRYDEAGSVAERWLIEPKILDGLVDIFGPIQTSAA